MAEAGGELVPVPATKLVEEVQNRSGTKGSVTACVVSLVPDALSLAARVCEQMRSARAAIVGHWADQADAPAAEKYLRSAGATPVTRTLGETLREVLPPKPADPKAEPRTPKRPAPAEVRAQEKATKTT